MKKAYKNLSEFIGALEEEGELLRVKKEVSSEIEISKITDAESKKPGGGKALFFENVKGSKFPVATNLFGSDKRMSMALGVECLARAGDEIEELTKLSPPRTFGEIFETAKKLLPMLRILPSRFRGKTAPCQEVVKTGADVDLSEIPVLKCWPKDAGKFVTLPLVFTKSPDGKTRNLGMYRLQIFDKNTTGMHWHIHKDGAHFYHEYKRLNKRMPVAVAIGADPSVIYAATAPLPRGIDELMLAGFFRKKPVKMVKCKTIDMEVPAEAEFVLEGYVEPDELRLEGPFGDHTGYYSLADMYPVFHVQAITRREKPIYCATLVGPPPMEDCYMAKATERIFLPLLKTVFPEIADYFLPWEGVFHNIAIVSIKKEYPAQAKRLISGLWGQGQMSFCKAIVVVDEDVEPSNLAKVWEKFAQNFDCERDLVLSQGVLDVLDHSAPDALFGAKIGIDLTAPIKGEPPRRKSEFYAQADAAEIAREAGAQPSDVFAAKGFCAIRMDKGEFSGREILREFSESDIFRNFRAVAIFDSNVDIFDTSKMLWKIFNNVDPSRDIFFAGGKTAFVDACKKTPADGHAREWPDELSFDAK
ncbi:MAG: menaquinone biosynthesis decarboxylase [Opitutales bacterium]|nr:menaquinone biosynthesis decarboxylase [Opitutales bacterium]